MSVGNLNTEGNKKNNFPWQFKMLKGLQAIVDTIISTISNYFSPRARKANVLSTTTAGTVPDCYSFSIANVGSAAGTVEGQTLPAGATVNFDAGTLNNYFKNPVIIYDATGTTFLITYITAL